jgi:hypothetical protein
VQLATAPVAEVSPPSSGGSTGTFAAIAGAALLLVIGILGPELWGRFRHRSTAA